jgi:putative endonuclease
MSAGSYYVYILASRHHGTIYIGVTNDIRARLELHRSGRGSKFVHRYKIFRLVHVEAFASPQEAIAREATQVLETGLEDQIDRGRESRLE